MAPKPENLFIRACSTGRHDLVKSLIDGGVSPETCDKYGLTGLIWAGRKGQVTVGEVLLDAGVEIDASDRRGRTALFHAIGYKRYAFVEFLIERGANLNLIDMHNWSPLDVATVPRNDKMIEILSRAGAQHRSTHAPAPRGPAQLNSFASPGIMGGDHPIWMERTHVQLNGLLRKWRGDYTNAVSGFSFMKYVDGSLIRHTENMQIVGAQKARRGRGWVTVKIGVPESWWREGETAYKTNLTGAIEQGLHSMIALLKRNKHEVKADLLLSNWLALKKEFIGTPAPPFAAESQRASLTSAVEEAVRMLEKKKRT
jgi:hypothetical protein